MNHSRYIAGFGVLTMAALMLAPAHGGEHLVAEVLHSSAVPQHRGEYRAWPTLARLRQGELIVVYSGGREGHIGPFGRVESVRSRDNGKTWSGPHLIFDSPTDDRDGGIVQTPSGTLIATTFTSNGWLKTLEEAQQTWTQNGGQTFATWHTSSWDAEKFSRWEAQIEQVPDMYRGDMKGWIIRSDDDGQSWGDPILSPVNTPHGPIVLDNEGLLFVGRTPTDVQAYFSADEGVTWQQRGTLPTRPGDDSRQYHEAHAVQLQNGTIVAQLRNHNPNHKYEVLQSSSTDGGRTWSVPVTTGVWGYPTHLLGLNDGRLLMSYSHRRDPFSIQARISDDDGASWSDPLMIADDIGVNDMGYPSTVQLDDGRLVTVWYQTDKGSRYESRLQLAVWRISPPSNRP